LRAKTLARKAVGGCYFLAVPKVFFDTNLGIYLFLASSENEDITKINKFIMRKGAFRKQCCLAQIRAS